MSDDEYDPTETGIRWGITPAGDLVFEGRICREQRQEAFQAMSVEEITEVGSAPQTMVETLARLHLIADAAYRDTEHLWHMQSHPSSISSH